jgi:hypothetical protein
LVLNSQRLKTKLKTEIGSGYVSKLCIIKPPRKATELKLWYKKPVARESPDIEAMRLPSSQINECPDELIGPRVSKEMGWKM